MLTIFLSSTFRDLETYRAEVLERLGRLDHVRIAAMENFGAREASPKDFCLEAAGACDIFIGLVGHLYGFVPEGDGLSLTELEYEAAAQAQRRRLMFVAPDDFLMPASLRQSDADRDRQSAFRARVTRELVVDGDWTTPDSLASSVITAVSNLRTSTAEARKETAESGGTEPAALNVSIYLERARKKWETIDLSPLAQPGSIDDARPTLRSLFVPQQARRSRPSVSLTRDYLRSQGLEVREDRTDFQRAQWEQAQRFEILDLLGERAARHIVILGDAGSGKSSLVRYVLLRLLESTGCQLAEGDWRSALRHHVPFLIELRDYVAREREGKCGSLMSYLVYLGREQGFGFNEQQALAQLSAGALVIVDGLDEIFDPVRRRGIAEETIGLATRFENSRFIVTSRIAGFDPFPFDAGRFVTVTLDDWDAEHIDRFVRAWFAVDGRPEQASDAAKELQATVAARPQLLAIAGNPLLLTMMAIVARHEALERSRVGLYEQALTTLSFTLDLKHKGLSLPSDSPLRGLGPRDRLALLRHVAWTMQKQTGGLRANAITEDQLLDALVAYLRRVFALAPDEANRGANELIQILQERNWILTSRGPRLYGFVHRTFLEYLCASHLTFQFRARKIELDGMIARFVLANAYDDTWHEVIRLLVGQLGRDGAEHARAVLEALLTTGTEPDADRTALALESLAEQEPASLAVLIEQVEVAVSHLAQLLGQWLGKKSFVGLERYVAALRGLTLPPALRSSLGFRPSIYKYLKVAPDAPDTGPQRTHELFSERAQLELIRAFWPPGEAGEELRRIAVRGWSDNRLLALTLLAERFTGAAETLAALNDRMVNDASPAVRAGAARLLGSVADAAPS